MIETEHSQSIRRLIEQHRGFIFDLDGTIYLGDELIPGAGAVIERLRAQGGRTAFLSNKPIARRETYAQKLRQLGIPCEVKDVINSSLVLARYLQREFPGGRVYPIAEQPVIDELREHGMKITDDPQNTDVVVVSWDRAFNYDKLNKAYRAAMNGARLVGTNPDRTCPMPGYDLPDAACMIAAVETCTERKVSPIVGKPSAIMVQEVLELLDLEPADCAMFGDRIDTDMLMARETGLTAVLVLTGVTTRAELDPAGVQPDVILDSVADLLSVSE
ncbi:MAG: HAD-IIA family hydrolase [Planctomycetota bacterium]